MENAIECTIHQILTPVKALANYELAKHKAPRRLAAAPAHATSNPAGESGQGHFVEIIVGILIVVVIGVFLYASGVPAIKDLWNDAMTSIGTIRPA